MDIYFQWGIIQQYIFFYFVALIIPALAIWSFSTVSHIPLTCHYPFTFLSAFLLPAIPLILCLNCSLTFNKSLYPYVYWY